MLTKSVNCLINHTAAENLAECKLSQLNAMYKAKRSDLHPEATARETFVKQAWLNREWAKGWTKIVRNSITESNIIYDIKLDAGNFGSKKFGYQNMLTALTTLLERKVNIICVGLYDREIHIKNNSEIFVTFNSLDDAVNYLGSL